MDGLSDIELWRRCRNGDRRAWRAFVQRFGGLVWRISVRVLGSEDEAHDAAQETFLRVHRSIASFDPTQPLKPWVARIATNACLRRIEGRARTPLPHTDGDAAERLPDGHGASPEAAARRGEVSERLLAGLATLDARDRALLVLRYREGLSDSEVAAATDLPVGTVKTRIYRARQALRAWLGPEGSELVAGAG